MQLVGKKSAVAAEPPCDHVFSALEKLDAWIEREEFQGWDPYDGLNSKLLSTIALSNRWLGVFFVQLLKRSPLNLRLPLGVPKGYNPKGMGLFLATYTEKFQISGASKHRDLSHFFARWLLEHVSPGYAGACWGYNFNWPNRGFCAPAGTPTIVNTSFISLAFLSAQTVLNSATAWTNPQEGEKPPERPSQSTLQFHSPLDVARSSCEFFLRDLNLTQPAPDEICFSYTPLDRRFVHNANVLAAWLLAEVFVRTQEAHLADKARAAARFTARRQRPDGSWTYGPASIDQWVDNHHTGYVLVALKRIDELLGMQEISPVIAKGYQFWKQRLFRKDGVPKFYHDRPYPIDVHCVAQAILTYLEFSALDPEALALARKLASWAVDEMQDGAGFFHYQIDRFYRIRIPYMRWCEAWMQRALTALRARSRDPGQPVQREAMHAHLG